ncbi:group 1 glycosyl transferase [Chitinophaga caeni]|uniref:Group 1 glycosyl transferase n=1 Tax=Chitinophaga caeni TaxID=2029983 RepID=A0A291QWX6_9BACT|nr:glycosyltransferase [Chitinophaga caeni]ATL48445.1 group 1 glycosyl transferase [Chitinophaga caeni]
MNTHSSKIKVLQAIRQGLIGGGETHVLGLVETLDRSIFDPIVLSFTDGPMIDRLQQMGVKNYVIPSTRPFDMKQWKAVKELIDQESIQIVHAHGSRAASNLLIPSKKAGLPFIYTVHGWSFHDDQPFLQKKLRTWSERWITRRSDRTISVSASNQATGKKHIPGFESIVINNGIDPKKFDANGTYHDIRAELGIPESHTLVTYIARITVQKDPYTLIRGFALAAKETENISLLVVGDGELKEEMIQLAEQLQVRDRIIFQPFRLDIPAILHAADIYCLPSLWEGLPIGLLEAMAMGTAVVATEVDGSKEIIQHLENGWLVEPQKPEQLSNAFLRLHQEIYFRNLLQKNAVQTTLEEYNLVRMTRAVEEVYLSVLRGRGTSGLNGTGKHVSKTALTP